MQILDNVKRVQINNEELMISFNLTTLFTSLEPGLAKETLSMILINDTNLSRYTKLKSQNQLELISLRLIKYFKFNNKIYV